MKAICTTLLSFFHAFYHELTDIEVLSTSKKCLVDLYTYILIA